MSDEATEKENSRLAEEARQAGTCDGCGRPAVPWHCRCGGAC